MARTKQTRRETPPTGLVAPSGLPLALREDINFGNIAGDAIEDVEGATQKVVIDKDILIPVDGEETEIDEESANDQEDDDEDEPESESAEVSPEEWAKEPSEQELRTFVTVPVASYDFKRIVGSGYLPGRARTQANFRYEVEYFNTLNPPSQVTGYTGTIPKGFSQDISKLQDCGNPRHFIEDKTQKYGCRWCGHNFSKSSNKVSHEKSCGAIGAPGHKCDINCHNPAIGLECVGAGIYTPDKDNDGRKENSRGNIVRKKKAAQKNKA